MNPSSHAKAKVPGVRRSSRKAPSVHGEANDSACSRASREKSHSLVMRTGVTPAPEAWRRADANKAAAADQPASVHVVPTGQPKAHRAGSRSTERCHADAIGHA